VPELWSAESMKALTRRQQTIMREVMAGNTNKEIGVNLGISQHTVSAHLRVIMRKLGVHNRYGAVAAFVNQEKKA
jgi:DNA-binding CsgD family transcriptional regulator